ncbi:MAG: DUF4224 domain-containing protein [Nitrosomonadales bacterium]|nr:DUF4224 domain-containing protein [Nitrosomonadales bacterium]
MERFLSDDDVRTLTGFAHKSRQIGQLRRMGIPFFVNGCGRAVVPASAIEGGHKQDQQSGAWSPKVLQSSMR